MVEIFISIMSNKSKLMSENGAQGETNALELENVSAQDLVLLLSALESERDGKRIELENLFEEMQTIRGKMETIENSLHNVDDKITEVEQRLESYRSIQHSSEYNSQAKAQDEIQAQDHLESSASTRRYESDVYETQLTDPCTHPDENDTYIAHAKPPNSHTLSSLSTVPIQSTTSNSATGKINIKENPIQLNRCHLSSKHKIGNTGKTIDSFFKKSRTGEDQEISFTKINGTEKYTGTNYANVDEINLIRNDKSELITTHNFDHSNKTLSLGNTLAPSNSLFAKRPSSEERNSNYLHDLSTKEFPWTQQTMELLRNTFHILSFRDHQKEIINCTMLGDDAFVIMRTGGGKSLTYQLPALIEGNGPEKKVTFVISPLLSLIHDQVEQMNNFSFNSATSFTSGIGVGEHNQRWAQVRDRSSGICLVFVTPEKVHKSNKLRNELEKLHEQKRLGRFVIDECHCASQWGHDFRPDYTKLGVLKIHFPTVPVIAVTATASDKVRHDCCKILRLGNNYQFFRSTANRPNLTYSIVEKADGKDKVITQISNFIKTQHKDHAGIIYTFSRKDADEVACKLCDLGIVARSYHSSISPTQKERIHKSWMRNQTQVVVATIAFGLGINKPDVRFVLHHTLSKSLESYYQESGRAGRDGEHADCVLYYSAKDVSRMLCMIHGDNSEGSFWSMVRYAQTSGNDFVCRNLILRVLGEEQTNKNNVDIEASKNETTEERDVTQHAKTALQLVYSSLQRKKDWLTLNKLVQNWRSTSNNAPDL